MDLTNTGGIVSTIELLGSIASIIGLVLAIIAHVSSNHKKSLKYSPSVGNFPVTKNVGQEASFLPQTGNSLVPKDDVDAREKNKSSAANRRLAGAEADDLDH